MIETCCAETCLLNARAVNFTVQGQITAALYSRPSFSRTCALELILRHVCTATVISNAIAVLIGILVDDDVAAAQKHSGTEILPTPCV
jgi:hypothetical protein